MKWNWGKGIVVAIALFMSFILYFVISAQTDSKYDNEMVVEEYYKQEMLLQGSIDKKNNANALEEKVQVKSTEKGIEIYFPSSFDASKIQGKVSLYRPSNQKLDFEVPISISSTHLLIPIQSLVGGRWDISVDWQYEGKDYLSVDKVNL
jgi:hypothetical protein